MAVSVRKKNGSAPLRNRIRRQLREAREIRRVEAQVEEALRCGQDVVLKLDVQGAATIRKLYPQAILVFLVPNTVEEWYDRLSDRGSETETSLKVRVDTAIREIAQIDIFDYETQKRLISL